MKLKRSAISQSTDLFIIMAAVLTIAGVIVTAVFGLAITGTSISGIAITSADLTAGTSPTLAFTFKNVGDRPISSATATAILDIDSTGATFSITATNGNVWSGYPGSPTKFVSPPTISLPPNAYYSVVVSMSGTANVVARSSYTLVVQVGTVQASIYVIAR